MLLAKQLWKIALKAFYIALPTIIFHPQSNTAGRPGALLAGQKGPEAMEKYWEFESPAYGRKGALAGATVKRQPGRRRMGACSLLRSDSVADPGTVVLLPRPQVLLLAKTRRIGRG